MALYTLVHVYIRLFTFVHSTLRLKVYVCAWILHSCAWLYIVCAVPCASVSHYAVLCSVMCACVIVFFVFVCVCVIVFFFFVCVFVRHCELDLCNNLHKIFQIEEKINLSMGCVAVYACMIMFNVNCIYCTCIITCRHIPEY